ncbi:DUF4105 domain-containing protein [Aliidiomarina soli]|uniref:Lnb N-terminal periplasmic domain-containing protein n=1 Tax=Aliidiomarina soli TaxID=1928574 RepID=UPI0018E53C5B|nr:DUF4105 domain-containing protein [Aliidiomarina soli]
MFAQSDVHIQLAGDPTWLKLLHFDRHGVFTEPRSAVNDESFFLAQNGAHNPAAELAATIDALNEPFSAETVHASCRFPARAMWLKQQGVIESNENIHCPEWQEWESQHANGEVGLTFASGYLGNPASFFGHLLLHIKAPASNNSSQVTASHLLDSSLNFGADVPASDGMIPYMLKGLVGGYQARYSEAPFYRNTSLYSESQMRDSWFYELDLDDHERAFLVAHLYEVLGQNFDYLFLSQNCASRIGRTLELVIDDELTAGYAPWVSPEQVIRLAAPHSKEVHYYPSRRRITENSYHQLTAQEQAAVSEAWPALTQFSLSRGRLEALPTESQSAVLEVLSSHALFIQQSEHAELGKDVQHQVLQARLQLPTSDSADTAHHTPPAPDEVTPSAIFRLGATYTDSLGEGFQLSFRPLHYDLLESNDARMPYAALEIMQIAFDIYDSTPKLAQATLFNVTNLNALQTGLPIQSSLAWQAKAQISRNQLGCRDCLDAGLHMSAGKSWQTGDLTSYALFGGILRSTGYQEGFIAGEIQTGVIYDWSGAQRSLLSASYQNAGRGEDSRSWRLDLTHRVQLSTRHDVRMAVSRDRSSYQVNVNLGLYW